MFWLASGNASYFGSVELLLLTELARKFPVTQYGQCARMLKNLREKINVQDTGALDAAMEQGTGIVRSTIQLC
jgi:hypothetical protein